ncbi:MAG: glycosyltransferase [Faecalibacterium prausnitzii]|nr:glycosyltransferase [Faecalibacterium prausnitzii]
MPAVSVIIPVYNIKTLLPGGVASLQAQTWQDFEVRLRGGRDRRMQKNSR